MILRRDFKNDRSNSIEGIDHRSKELFSNFLIDQDDADAGTVGKSIESLFDDLRLSVFFNDEEVALASGVTFADSRKKEASDCVLMSKLYLQ